MTEKEWIAKQIMDTREAVRIHTECSIPERQADWAEEMKRRRSLPKRTPSPRPSPAASLPDAGTGKGSLVAGSTGVSKLPEASRIPRAYEEDGIDSYWFGSK
mgnify:CR=1 FL=1